MKNLGSSFTKYKFFAFYVLIFIIFFFTACHQKQFKYIWWDDTWSYLGASLSNPWQSKRTPGYLLYLKLLQADVPMRHLSENVKESPPYINTINKINSLIKSEIFITSFFRNIWIFHCLLLSLGCSLMTYALAKFIIRSTHNASSLKPWLMRVMLFFLIWFSIYKGNLPPLNSMLADTLVTILLLFTLSCILLYLSDYNNILLVASCVIAAYASLVKPGFYFLPLICGIICLIRIGYEIYAREFGKAARIFVIGIFLSALTLAWPCYLYIKGGIFIPSQISYQTNYAIAYLLARPGDDNLDIDPNSKEIIKKINEQRAEVIDIMKQKNIKYPYSSLAEMLKYYINSFDQVAWGRQQKIWQELNLPHGYLAYARQINDFAPKIIREHRGEYFKLLLANFIGTFNLFPQSRYAYAWWISDHYRSAFLIICLALICGMRNFRIPIALFASAHILYMLFCSFGGYIASRYVCSTEFTMLLAFLLSLFSLLLRAYGIGYKLYVKYLPLKSAF